MLENNQNDKKMWLKWVADIQAIAQNGLTYTKDIYDKERFEQLMQLSLEILQKFSDVKFEFAHKVFHEEVGLYATPKIGVASVVFKDDKILLVKELADGLWSVPGGWADVNETPSQCAEKELFEESGFEGRAIKLLYLSDRNCHTQDYLWPHVYKAFFLCKITGGEAKSGIETLDVGFFWVK
jgi:ADP-ribose pyrophosphatase YjhB (NUDIX family)